MRGGTTPDTQGSDWIYLARVHLSQRVSNAPQFDFR